MQQGRVLEANSWAAKEMSRSCMKTECSFPYYNIPPPIPILSLINPICRGVSRPSSK
jgi:hypothetical protein